MESNIIEFPQRIIYYPEGQWPFVDADIDELTTHKLQKQNVFQCPGYEDVIQFIGRVFQIRNVSILIYEITRTESGFDLIVSAVDPDAMNPNSFGKTYVHSDIQKIFSEWPIEQTCTVYCSDSGDISLLSGGEFSWITVDWPARKKAFLEKLGLKPR
jgi:hypothetical protein